MRKGDRQMLFDCLQNSENITLPNIVITIPNTVRFSFLRKRSTRLSYQNTRERNSFKDFEFSLFYNYNSKNNLLEGQPFNQKIWDRFKEYLQSTQRKKYSL
jgi:hypothetical protein